MIKLRIWSSEDFKAIDGKLFDAELDDAVITEAVEDGVRIAVIEKGSVTGKTGIEIFLTDDNGITVKARLTMNEMDMLAGALRGAKERFGGV